MDVKNMHTLEQEFRESFELHADALFKYCSFKVSERELATDLVQETFMKTWVFLTEGGTVDSMKPFLFRTLRNLIIDHYRRKKSVSLDALTEDGFDPGVDETEELFDKLDGTRVKDLLRDLPQEYGDIIFMRYVENMSLDEIAMATGLTKNTATVRIHRGLQKLKKLFEHEY
jgi:RNA polymerase sigma-70 factor, ECF subfamily